LWFQQQQQQRTGSAGASSPFRKLASHGGDSGADNRHGSSTEVRRSVSPHRPPSAAATTGGSSSATPSRLGGQHRDKASPARQTNDRTQLLAKSSPLHTQELLNKGICTVAQKTDSWHCVSQKISVG